MTVLASPFTALFSLAWLLARYATRADEAGKKVEELQLASEQDESGAEKTERPKVSSSSVCGSLGRKVLPQLVFWITLAPALLLDGQRASSSTLRDGLLLLAASASFDGCMLPAVFALACSLTLSSTALLPVCASLPVLLCAVQNARKQKTSFLRQTLYLCALLLLLHHIALRSSSSSERHGGSLLSLLSYILQRALTVPGRLAAAFTAVSPLLCVEGNLIGALSRLVNSHFLPFLTSSGGSEATLSSIDAGSGSLLPELGGLGWYVASSVFSRYLPYYRVILALQPLLYVLPLCWRLRKRMDLALVIVMAVATLLDSSATSADGSSTNLTRFPLVAALMLSHSTVVSRMSRGIPHVWLGLLVAAVVASPSMKRVWLVNAAASGANLLLNMSLGITVAGGSVVAEYTLASLRAVRVGEALVQTAATTAAAAAAPASTEAKNKAKKSQ